MGQANPSTRGGSTVNMLEVIAASRRRAALPPSGYDVVIEAWLSGIAAAGGAISSNNAAAWNAVIAGARAAGYLSGIKSLVALAGPNYAGAYVPLIGAAAPTPTGFSAADHTPATGIVSNGSGYLQTRIFSDSTDYFGGQDDFLLGGYISQALPAWTTQRTIIGDRLTQPAKAIIYPNATAIRFYTGSASGTAQITVNPATFAGFFSMRRSGPTSCALRAGALTGTHTAASGGPGSNELFVFRAATVSTVINSGFGIGAYFAGLSTVDEAHFRGLLDTCFAALT